MLGAPPPVPGIPNVGNSCFLNVVLQSMAACPELVRFAREASACGGGAAVTEALHGCLAALAPYGDAGTTLARGGFTFGAEAERPAVRVALRALLAAAFPDAGALCSFRQEDAHEVFQYLANAVDGETGARQAAARAGLLRSIGTSPSAVPGSERPSITAPASPSLLAVAAASPLRSRVAPAAYHGLVPPVPVDAGDNPIPERLPPYLGLTGSSFCCTVCGARSGMRCSPFFDLQLSMPFGGAPQYGHSLSIMDLFAAYTAPEAVHGVACSSCSGQVVAHKTLSVARVPSALCILVQRLGVMGKSDAHIAFPLAARFTSRSMTAVPLGPGTAGAAGAPPHALVAVVEHLGSDGRGHYTVLRRVGGPADWVLISDASVTRVSLERVFAARAYMLFYSREVGSVGNGEASMH